VRARGGNSGDQVQKMHTACSKHGYNTVSVQIKCVIAVFLRAAMRCRSLDSGGEST
jgi:hypothetical protein